MIVNMILAKYSNTTMPLLGRILAVNAALTALLVFIFLIQNLSINYIKSIMPITDPIFSFVLIPLIIALIITVILTPFFIKINKRLKLIDDPSRHRHPAMLHTKIIPRGGGIPFFLGIMIAGLFLLPLTTKTVAIYIAGIIALIIGVIDDRFNAEGRDISPYIRLVFNIICASNHRCKRSHQYVYYQSVGRNSSS